MARVNIKQEEVQSLLVKHLIDTLKLNESRCYETIRPDILPKIPSGSDWVLTVSLGDGEFGEIEEQFAGQCFEKTDVTVMAFARTNLDPTNPDTALLHETNRGLLRLKTTILKAMVGEDPPRETGEGFLRNILYAKRSIAPDILEGGKGIGTVGSVGIVFGVDFDHDLS